MPAQLRTFEDFLRCKPGEYYGITGVEGTSYGVFPVVVKKVIRKKSKFEFLKLTPHGAQVLPLEKFPLLCEGVELKLLSENSIQVIFLTKLSFRFSACSNICAVKIQQEEFEKFYKRNKLGRLESESSMA